MQLGPTIIRKCFACAKLIAQETLVSGNTFEARFWTDGKREAPMWPDLPLFVKCPHCLTLLWIEEQEKIDEVLPYFVEQEFPLAKPYRTVELQDYFDTLKQHHVNSDKEFYLRLRAWWKGNDLRRNSKNNEYAELTNQEIENLQHLFLLLEISNEHHRLMMAEIYRELGQFKEAEILLCTPFSNDLKETAAFILELVHQHNPFVAEIKSDS